MPAKTIAHLMISCNFQACTPTKSQHRTPVYLRTKPAQSKERFGLSDKGSAGLGETVTSSVTNVY